MDEIICGSEEVNKVPASGQISSSHITYQTLLNPCQGTGASSQVHWNILENSRFLLHNCEEFFLRILLSEICDNFNNKTHPKHDPLKS